MRFKQDEVSDRKMTTPLSSIVKEMGTRISSLGKVGAFSLILRPRRRRVFLTMDTTFLGEEVKVRFAVFRAGDAAFNEALPVLTALEQAFCPVRARDRQAEAALWCSLTVGDESPSSSMSESFLLFIAIVQTTFLLNYQDTADAFRNRPQRLTLSYSIEEHQ